MASELQNPSLPSTVEERYELSWATEEKQFICPGEKLPISRSIHVARLAAFYPACRECPHRSETGHLPAKTIEHLKESQKRIGRTDLFTKEGIRGVFLNEIDRSQTERIVSAFAALVLENYPRRYRNSDENKTCDSPRPRILVGHDFRPSSFELMAVVIGLLRRMGVMVTEIGLSSHSSLCFAVKHLEANAGILITGSGCDPAWTGFDFVGESAVPYSLGGSLSNLKLKLLSQISRPSRLGGSLNSFQAAIPYRISLWKHFQHLKPLEIVCGTSDPFTKQTLLEIFAKLPCNLRFVDLPLRKSQTSAGELPQWNPLGNFVVQNEAHLGLNIKQDGMTCHVIDDRGELVLPSAIICLLLANSTSSKVSPAIVLTHFVQKELQTQINIFDQKVFTSENNMEVFCKTMHSHDASFGAEEAGRYWFRETRSTCDAVLLLGVMLQILSRTERPLSSLVKEAQTLEKESA